MSELQRFLKEPKRADTRYLRLKGSSSNDYSSDKP